MKKNKQNISRRGFLAAGAATIAAPLFLPGRILGLDGTTPPNEKLTTAVVGVGNRGRDLLHVFRTRKYQCIGVCDCFKQRAENACNTVNQQYNNQDCLIFPKYEDALAHEKLDIIAIGTPDHWHTKITVEACKAGKDVFCEKPLTLTLAEGLQIVEAARKYNRVASSGSQRVWEDYGHYMAPIIQSGAIGKVKEVFCGVNGPPKTCYLPEQRVPDGLDWDRWLGQAPLAPYNEERMSGNYGGGWRQFEEYGNGFLADWGAHKFGGALYALGLDLEDPVEILPANTENNPAKYFCAVFKNGLRMYHVNDGAHDVRFVGTEGSFDHRDPVKPKPLGPVNIRRYSGPQGDIYDDFDFCVRNRLRPFQDLEYGARTAAFCQLMAICYKLNRPLKWNQEKYRFENDEQANRMITRPQRTPFGIEV
ncbi:MAG: Gfo/Idh/MocA family oxidoreductase [Planctomycetaceae bacterium]|nr:Gfo/Idh/MocA family oxidoreductase [Planctomycetaceae bacterium]